MTTKFMFVRDTHPLARTRVRMVGEDGRTSEWVTDEEGRIEAEVGRGPTSFQIAAQPAETEPLAQTAEWTEHVVDTSEVSSSLVVVNISSASPPTAPRTSFFERHFDDLDGRYRYEETLGRGGMGVVFRAEDTILGRTVAVKVLNDELQDSEEAQEIFLTEARALAGLTHPNLVAIHDVLDSGGIALMVTEYIDGKNVERWLKKHGALTPPAVLELSIQLADVLAYMHKEGFIHRDVKPGNLIIKPDGELKVIDFGLARSLDEITIRGTRVRGTPAYMAPEQIRGEDLTAQTDLYQFGITLYEVLSGKLPFTSGDMGYAHVHTAPQDIREAAPTTPEPLARLVMLCLAKDPAGRPRSAEEIARALRRIKREAVSGATAELRAVGAQISEPEGETSAGVIESRVPATTAATYPSSPGASSMRSSGVRAAKQSSPPEEDIEDVSSRRIKPVVLGALVLLAIGALGAGALFMSVEKSEGAPESAQDSLATVTAPPPAVEGEGAARREAEDEAAPQIYGDAPDPSPSTAIGAEEKAGGDPGPTPSPDTPAAGRDRPRPSPAEDSEEPSPATPKASEPEPAEDAPPAAREKVVRRPRPKTKRAAASAKAPPTPSASSATAERADAAGGDDATGATASARDGARDERGEAEKTQPAKSAEAASDASSSTHTQDDSPDEKDPAPADTTEKATTRTREDAMREAAPELREKKVIRKKKKVIRKKVIRKKKKREEPRQVPRSF